MKLIKEILGEFVNDDCPRMAAALAYYTVFALPPMLVLILMVTGLFVDPDRILELMQGQIGGQAAEQVQSMVESGRRKVSGGLSLALVLSVAGLIFSASGAFAQFQMALNSAWDVEPDPREKGFGKVVHLVTKRFLSLGMVVVVAFLLVVALVVSGTVSAFTRPIANYLGGFGFTEWAATTLLWTADAVVFTSVLWLLFSALFMVLPDARICWKDVRLGAFVTAVLFVIGKLAIGWYVGRSEPGSAFGAAGALAVILLFVYYASMIVLLGAEFTQVWTQRHGRSVRPAKHAVRIVKHKEFDRSNDARRASPEGASPAV